jgi:hypothetical protein
VGSRKRKMIKSRWQQYKEKNGVTPLDLLNPKTKDASDAVARARMEICEACPQLIPITKQCRQCGCFMPLKTKLEYALCPLNKWNSPSNLIIIPSRNRVNNVNRAIEEIKNTATMSHIMIGLDDDNESIYPRIDGVIYEVNERLRMNGTLNLLAMKYADQYKTITFMGDDHVPRTYGWDAKLYSSIEKRGYGVSYGNDLFQGENLPTAVMMSTNIIKTLGFMAPPPLIHMFMDNFWKSVGERLGALQYIDDVIIEHMHAYVGKSELDEMYLSVNNEEVGSHDGAKYGEYMQNQFESDLIKLKEALIDIKSE